MNRLHSRGSSLLLLAILLSPAAVIEARASTPVLDQQNVATTKSASLAVYSGQRVAQTFTVGKTGYLDEVGLQISRSAGITGGSPVFRILPTTGDGAPTTAVGNDLYSAVLDLNSIPVISTAPSPFTTVDVSSARLWVNAGDRLALTLERAGSGSPPWLVWDLVAQGYENGMLYTRHTPELWVVPSVSIPNQTDAGFRTYIAVPEPPAIATAALLFMAVGLRPRR
jgi:hypothetical protein